MRISIFGMGYVGCASGACLASHGHQVIGVEPNPMKVALINSGKSPIIESGLGTLIETTVAQKQFVATEDWRFAIENSDMAFVCVGTPSCANGSIDLKFVRRVCEQIGQALADKKEYFTVVIRSTVLPGTVEGTVIPILEASSGKKAGQDFGVCMNPEFLREGTSVHDFHHPPKTVIGELDKRSGEKLDELYEELPGPHLRIPIRIAEMVKYVDNTFHALKVSFANEIGNICKELKIDSHRVMDIFCMDTKLNLSPYYLKPGFSFGGSCLPKDLRAIINEAKTHDLNVPLLSAVLESNRLQTQKVVQQLLQYKGESIGFLGLSFKGGTDDLRESPIVDLVETMIGKGFNIKIYDRHVSLAKLMGANKEFIEQEIPHISRLMCSSCDELIDSTKVIVVGNRTEEFEKAISVVNSDHIIIDLVRIVQERPEHAAEYHGICW